MLRPPALGVEPLEALAAEDAFTGRAVVDGAGATLLPLATSSFAMDFGASRAKMACF